MIYIVFRQFNYLNGDVFNNYAQRSAVWGVARRLAFRPLYKNRDTRRGSLTGAGAGCGGSHKTASLVTQLLRHGAPMTYADLSAAGIYFFVQK
jgi:hypothetical protein